MKFCSTTLETNIITIAMATTAGTSNRKWARTLPLSSPWRWKSALLIFQRPQKILVHSFLFASLLYAIRNDVMFYSESPRTFQLHVVSWWESKDASITVSMEPRYRLGALFKFQNRKEFRKEKIWRRYYDLSTNRFHLWGSKFLSSIFLQNFHFCSWNYVPSHAKYFRALQYWRRWLFIENVVHWEQQRKWSWLPFTSRISVETS